MENVIWNQESVFLVEYTRRLSVYLLAYAQQCSNRQEEPVRRLDSKHRLLHQHQTVDFVPYFGKQLQERKRLNRFRRIASRQEGPPRCRVRSDTTHTKIRKGLGFWWVLWCENHSMLRFAWDPSIIRHQKRLTIENRCTRRSLWKPEEFMPTLQAGYGLMLNIIREYEGMKRATS